jgi:dihydrolipoamide dehydrogenase
MTHELTAGVAVLGGGPGGYTAAFRAADLGARVCLIEQGPGLGGVCLNVGCIPSKTLLHAVAVIEAAGEASAFGIGFAGPTIDLDALRAHKDQIITQLTGGLDRLCQARGITQLTGRGRFTDDRTLRVETAEGDTRIRFEAAVIATGSRPVTLDIAPDDVRMWDSTAALALPFLPQRLLIIGGGNIGLEMAQIYHALGSAITIVELQDQLISAADRDLVQPLFLQLKKRYRILTKAKVEGLTATPKAIQAVLSSGAGPVTDDFDAVLVATGRRPNTEDLGLETIGLAPDSRGLLRVNERQQTDRPHIYAIGDVVPGPMLAHKASHQGKVAAEVIAGLASTFAPLAIPSVAYTTPEVAWMGLSEQEAQQQGIPLHKGKFPWGASGRAVSAGATTGVSKVLFDARSGRIVGAGICGLNAGELIHEAVLALEMGATAEDIARTVHAHPTLAETFACAAEMVDGSITDILPPKRLAGR